MYCPECLNESLSITNKGIIHVIINKKQLDNGRFYFNRETESDAEILEKLKGKIEEFFKWYTRFQNMNPVNSLELASNSVYCIHGCKLEPTLKFSIIDNLFSKEEVYSLVIQLADKYKIKTELK